MSISHLYIQKNPFEWQAQLVVGLLVWIIVLFLVC